MLKSNSKLNFAKKELKALKKDNLYNNLPTLSSPVDAKFKINSKNVLNLCSNNYLGLANDKRLKKAAIKAIKKYGVNTAAVRPISGNHALHQKLEKTISKFKKTADTLVVQSGFNANLAVIPTITGPDDIIFSDELNHASIIDACRLSRAQVVRYNHSSAKDLEQKITNLKNTYNKGLIVTDGVFSMDGDLPPLPRLAEIAQKYNLLLMVDDAHGEGVLGSHGRGIVDHFDLHGQVDIEVGTLSKAFGVTGGFITGDKILIELLRQKARPFLFSTGLSIGDTAAALKSVKILQKSGHLVEKLWENADYLKLNLSKAGFNTGNSQTPITPVILGEAELAQNFSKNLLKKGIFAKAIVYPTVPKGTARIRIMPSAAHSKKDLDKAVKAFQKVGQKLKVV